MSLSSNVENAFLARGILVVDNVYKLQKKLAAVDHIYATPHQSLDALDAAIRASREAL